MYKNAKEYKLTPRSPLLDPSTPGYLIQNSVRLMGEKQMKHTKKLMRYRDGLRCLIVDLSPRNKTKSYEELRSCRSVRVP